MRACERCGKTMTYDNFHALPPGHALGSRVTCHRCKRRHICRDCAVRDFATWWCASDTWRSNSSPEDCYQAERARIAKTGKL